MLLQVLLVVATTLLALPAVVLLLQVLAARIPSGASNVQAQSPRPRVAVLMPAHNEAAGISTSLASVRPQLHAGDRLLVVADNCSDETAAVAAAAGAEVVQRHDDARRGKGFALDHGIRHLASDAPAVVVMLDADCVLSGGSLDVLALRCARTGHPVQALNLMLARENAGLRERMAEFAWRVKNQLRPLGAQRLGAPCQLMGTGMAFPWPLIAEARLATDHLAEDMKLGIDLALAGHAACFEAHALVTSRFPEAGGAVARQRTRWEHGHIAMLLGHGPKLLSAGLMRQDPKLVALAADLMVPPLALLLLLNAAMAGLNVGVALVSGQVAAAGISALASGLLAAAVLTAWWRVGRELVSLGELASAPLYAFRKLPVYLKLVAGRRTEWVRAKRDGE